MRLIDADALAKAFREASETDDSKDNRTYWSEALISAAEEVDDAPTVKSMCWIPVEERLPEEHGETYIVTISDGSVYSSALQWDAKCKRWYLSFLNNDGNILTDYIEDVTAWMSLPKPWRGEANDG